MVVCALLAFVPVGCCGELLSLLIFPLNYVRSEQASTHTGFVFPSPPPFLSEQFVKTVPEYHVVHPARVDASGHFLSFNLHHHISSLRKKRDLGKSENVVYYKINHEKKDLFFNLTVHMGFLSHNYVVERRRGNHTRAKISTHSGVPCHFLGTAWQPGSGSGTAAISTCIGLVSGVTFTRVLDYLWSH